MFLLFYVFTKASMSASLYASNGGSFCCSLKPLELSDFNSSHKVESTGLRFGSSINELKSFLRSDEINRFVILNVSSKTTLFYKSTRGCTRAYFPILGAILVMFVIPR